MTIDHIVQCVCGLAEMRGFVPSDIFSKSMQDLLDAGLTRDVAHR